MFQLSRHYGITLLIALLVCTYTFTNAGRFHIIDEVDLFAVTESLALRGAVDTNSIAWTQWEASAGEGLGAFGKDGNVYSKKGPAPAFLAVPWYHLLRLLARQEIQFGLLQGALLWNGLITALTAAVLWLTAVRLGYTERTGAWLGLLFGLSTIAWPYANHFFGEPLSALAILTCYYGILAWRQSHSYGWLWLGGIAGGVVIATVTTHILLIVILEIYLFYVTWRAVRNSTAPPLSGQERLPKQPLSAMTLAWGAFHFLAPIALAGMLVLWYNLVRFGNPLDTGFNFDAGFNFDSGEGFSTPIGQGLWGLLVSPYRGIFWHTPLFLASLAAFPRFFRRHRADGLVILTITLTLVGLYSMWWMWWGGFAWGPRFLVPLTPLWVLLLAEWLEGAEQQPVAQAAKSMPAASSSPELSSGTSTRVPLQYSNISEGDTRTSLVRYSEQFAETAESLSLARTRMPFWLLLIALLSMSVQILAVAQNYVNFEMQLRTIFPSDLRDRLANPPPAQALGDFLYSPVIGQIRLLQQGWLANSDLAWLPADGDVKWILLLVGIAAIATLAYLLRDWWRWAFAYEPERPGLPLWATVWLVPLVLISVWLAETAKDPFYGVAGQGYRGAVSTLCSQARRGDSVIALAPASYPVAMNWLGTQCPLGIPFYGYTADSGEQPEAIEAMQRLLTTSTRLWYITGELQANDPENSTERWLAQNGYKASDDWFDNFRLARYATEQPLQGTPALPHNAQLSDDENRVTIIASKAPVVARAGDVIPIRIEFLIESTVNADLRWFVQILNQEGAAIAQLDTAPADNYLQFSALPVNQLQVERAGLWLAPDLPAGQYRLIAGLYNPAANAARLQLSDGGDFVLLSFITVE